MKEDPNTKSEEEKLIKKLEKEIKIYEHMSYRYWKKQIAFSWQRREKTRSKTRSRDTTSGEFGEITIH